MSSKRLYAYAGILSLAFCAWTWMKGAPVPASAKRVWRSLANVAPRSPTSPPAAPIAEETPSVQVFLQNEAQRIGHIDPEPERTLLRLKDFAQKLGPDEFVTLSRAALNIQLGGDMRFLAVYLMSLAEGSGAVPPLMTVAEAPLPKVRMDSRLYDQEILIRTQALEGIARRDSVQIRRRRLQEYILRQGNVSLVGQAHRLLRNL